MKPLRRSRFEPGDVGMYVRLAYWGTWDRIIAVSGSWVAVIGLTPVNRAWRSDNQVGQVRCHCTSPEGDLLASSLPEKVEAEVRAHGLGWALDAQPGDLVLRFLDAGVEDRKLAEMLRDETS